MSNSGTHQKEPVLFGEMADSRFGQLSWGHLDISETNRAPKFLGSYHRTQNAIEYSPD